MRENLKLKEQINHKVISMIDLAVEDIFQPDREYQSGAKSITAGFFDKYGNRFDLNIELTVTSGLIEEDIIDPSSNQMDLLLERIEALEAYHKTPSRQGVVDDEF